jgi:hypothetical protein
MDEISKQFILKICPVLETTEKLYLDDSDLSDLEVEVSDLDLHEHADNARPLFFRPYPKDDFEELYSERLRAAETGPEDERGFYTWREPRPDMNETMGESEWLARWFKNRLGTGYPEELITHLKWKGPL